MRNDDAPSPDGSGPAKIAELFEEGARLHGDDWQAICAHVRHAIGKLPPALQARLGSDIDRIARFEPPPANRIRRH